jgi:hypothetical protein
VYPGINDVFKTIVTELTLLLPNLTAVEKLEVAVYNLPTGIDMLIGLNVITRGDFAICNSGGQTQISFVSPPLNDKIDFTSLTSAT